MKADRIRRRTIRQRRRLIVATFVVTIIIALVLGFNIYTLNNKRKANMEKKQELEKALYTEQLRGEALDELEKNINSDEYVEKLAREKFNLAYPGDIVFKPE